MNLNGNNLVITNNSTLTGVVQGPGTLTNEATLTIADATIDGGATLENAVTLDSAGALVIGTILQTGALTLGAGPADAATLLNDQGATYDILADVGIASAGTTVLDQYGLFEKTAGTATSTIQPGMTNTGTVLVTTGTLDLAGSVVNDGLLNVTGGGTLVVDRALAADAGQTGAIGMRNQSTVALMGAVAAEEAVTFRATGESLIIGAPTRMNAAIYGFSPGDTILLPGVPAGTLSYQQNKLTIASNGTTTASLLLPGTYTTSDFQESAQPGGLAITTDTPPCFLAGTRIATADGEKPVEALRAGDWVRQANGRLERIVWIGRRTVDCRGHGRPEAVRPVRILAGSFGPSRPARDLLLSPDHAIFAEGVLIQARDLINGATIVQEDVAEAAYLHVELTRHGVLLAENLPVESYLDTGNRAAFANGAPSPLRSRAAASCAPLCLGGDALAAVRALLLDRAALHGFRVTADADPHLLVDGCRVAPDPGTHRFTLPRASRHVIIASHAAAPAELDPSSCDRRRVGVAIASIACDGATLPLTSPALAVGFFPLEHTSGASWRWTNGQAVLHLSHPARRLDLSLCAEIPSWRRYTPALSPAAERDA